MAARKSEQPRRSSCDGIGIRFPFPRLLFLGGRELEDPAGQRADEGRLEAGVPRQRHRHLLRQVAPDQLRRRRGRRAHGLAAHRRSDVLLLLLLLLVVVVVVVAGCLCVCVCGCV